MNEDFVITEPEDLQGSRLPYNYLPGAFRATVNLARDEFTPGRIVFVLSKDNETPRSGLEYHVASAKTLAVPNDLFDFLKKREFSDEDIRRRCFLGPTTTLDETEFDQPLSLAFGRLETASLERFDQFVVLIDIGIAFWNRRFQALDGCNFQAMRYLDFDETSPGRSSFSGLTDKEIEDYCKIAQGLGGSEAVVAALGTRFPTSYFGAGGGALPDTLWHGTAMADLMAGMPDGAQSKTALFGIELPMVVLRDADGDNLTAVLTLLIEAALEMTANHATKPLTIVLPWGFSAGLQDGTHPAAMAIQNALLSQRNRKVELLVSAGNQLQDRCCARLKPSASQDAASVYWELPPDDFSENTAEFIVTPPQSANVAFHQTVRLKLPNRRPYVIVIKENQRVFIVQFGQVIGVLVRYIDEGSTRRLRLTLGQTGWQSPGQIPCPSGKVQMSFDAKDDVALWNLRDDRDPMFDHAMPRRPSAFFDLAYRERDGLGNFILDDSAGSSVVRSGTVSVLATAEINPALPQSANLAVVAVQANEVTIYQREQQSFYSGRRSDGKALATSEVVDRDRQGSGVLAAANGGPQRIHVGGTSAAVALHARRVLGLPDYEL